MRGNDDGYVIVVGMVIRLLCVAGVWSLVVGGDVLMGVGIVRVGRLLESDRVVGRISPVWLATRILGVNLWSKQAEILNAVRDHNYVAVRSCNGSGKTFTAALATLWWLVCHDEAIVITTAPSERQVREILWREIRSLHSKTRYLVGGKMSKTRLEFSANRFGFGFTTTSMNRIQGFHSANLLVVVDEASGVNEEIFSGLSSCLTTSNAKMLMLGNPLSSSGTFYDAFHGNSENWKGIHISVFDLPAFENLDIDSLLHDSVESLNAKGELSELNGSPPGMASPRWAKVMTNLSGGVDTATYRMRVLGEFADDCSDWGDWDWERGDPVARWR